MTSSRWPERKITELSEFEALIGSLRTTDPTNPVFYFRGQSSHDWSLTPSICRHLPPAFKPEHGSWVEIRSILEFQRRAHLVLDSSLLPGANDVIEWLTIMQHYGAPTRLLDWTASPYVALYFGVEQNYDVDGAVWYFDTEELNKSMHGLYSDKYRWFDKNLLDKKTLIYNDDLESAINWSALQDHTSPNMLFKYGFFGDRRRASERMIAQKGTFTYSKSIKGDHAESVADGIGRSHSGDPTKFCKVIIPGIRSCPRVIE